MPQEWGPRPPSQVFVGHNTSGNPKSWNVDIDKPAI
jgi:hypothetical protein